MTDQIKNITIVGGGTSGWITACYLARYFGRKIASGEMSITVIESPNIGIIGVGESTARPMADLLRLIGVPERDFVKRCNATFKLGGLFANWDFDEDGNPVSWINPFFSQSDIHGVNPAYMFAQYAMEKGGDPIKEDYTEAVSVCPALIRACKGPRPLNAQDYQSEIPYSYHMDALELAKILQDHGKKLGIRQILDNVVDVKLDERGFVEALSLKENGEHPIEFVIDATGFASIIIGKVLGEPFESYEKYMPNDRAAVMQLPHNDPTQLEPASRATALKAGWSFRVPLFNRVGTGYIFSSKFLSDDEAIAELKEFTGAPEEIEPRIIRMRIGKVRRSWVKNCLALGLSSGFVEPLEATAIYSVQVALQWLVRYFPDMDFNPAVTDRYNGLIDGLYEEIVNFISLLFCISNRGDTPFWKAARHELEIPEQLKENLNLWKSALPEELDLKTSTFFTPTSYRAALMG
ncbi:MAG: tryptophan halogenase family protein, partial [Pseudomonadota bacterium]